jgi:poly-gamma-glutamate synthesis protein (capsule biosynthesis protein)
MGALLPPPAAPFAATIAPLGEATFAAMQGASWKDDPRCPRAAALAEVRLMHLDLDGAVRTGHVIVAAAIAPQTAQLFGRLYAIGFPLRRVEPVDAHDADDDRSMAADNTSAFNFRVVAGTTTLSQHALGLAIDLNPLENPMIWPAVPGAAPRFVPPDAADFLDRRRVRPGMIVRPGPVTAILDELGWEWGGDWRHVADLHHIVWNRPLR